MNSILNTPVLIIAFNRPETTQIVFERIREVKPQKLYIAIDGPRKDINGEEMLCKSVIEILRKVDWECKTQYLIAEKNQGCKIGITNAISWVLNQEDRVIIIEDDVVPAIPFFFYAQELLELYKNDIRIGMISANNYTPLKYIESDYFFSKFAHIWGWATWKRVWDKFDVNAPDLEHTLKQNFEYTSIKNPKEKKYFYTFFNKVLIKLREGTQNAWGPQFFFFILKNNLLSITPKYNLASNIGLIGEHTDGKHKFHFFKTNDKYQVTFHPKEINANKKYDNKHFKNHINKKESILFRIFRKLSRKL